MLDGHVLIDAHVHLPVLGSLRPAWIEWARDFGEGCGCGRCKHQQQHNARDYHLSVNPS